MISPPFTFRPFRFAGLAIIVCLLAYPSTPARTVQAPYIVVLGIGQDGGIPQAGTKQHAGWTDEAFRRRVVCLGLIDPVSGQRWMFDATPDFREQLHMLDEILPVDGKPGLSGIFLTHAHIGHYTGLMFLGYESLGAKDVPVYVMPRMKQYLSSNGPWDQLVRYSNIALQALENGVPVRLNERLSVTPFLVPHRQEYSEVVGFRIDGPERSVLFIPDIDSWEEWDEAGTRIEDMIASVDVAYLDGTFYSSDEMPGRDMTGIPHPFITHSLNRFGELPLAEKTKVRFIHLNHTNPALWPDGEAHRSIVENGFRVANEGEQIDLSSARESSPSDEPIEYIYATHGGVDLEAFVFSPAPDQADAPRSAIVVFHGGGWAVGSPRWAFSRARHFAELGMVSVAAQFRLSDQKAVTPLEAMEDARAVIRWMRSNAEDLGIAPDRIAAYGWSSGGHLAACAAIFNDMLKDAEVNCAPNALILLSPAVSLASDSWPQRLLGTRASVDEISPDMHVRKGLPPTIILQGRTDSVTPLSGAQRFCDRMRAAGNRCDLHIYDGVGHLFTPAGEPDDGYPNPDPEVQAAAYHEIDEFLVSLGFIK